MVKNGEEELYTCIQKEKEEENEEWSVGRMNPYTTADDSFAKTHNVTTTQKGSAEVPKPHNA